jgi:hypothetical protein
VNPSLQAYGARLRSTLPGDLAELGQRHEAVVAAGADVVPDWLALVSRLTLAGLDALTVGMAHLAERYGSWRLP